MTCTTSSADDAADQLRSLVVGVSKGAFKAMKYGILTSDDLTPGVLISAAASRVRCEGHEVDA